MARDAASPLRTRYYHPTRFGIDPVNRMPLALLMIVVIASPLTAQVSDGVNNSVPQ